MQLDQLTEEYADTIAIIRYHVNWPSSGDPFYLFNPDESMNRNGFYGNSYTPHLFIDGSVDAGSNYSGWGTMFMDRYAIPSDWQINANGTFNPITRVIHLNISIDLDGENPDGVEFIRTALTESDLHFNAPNGLTVFNQVFRNMMPIIYGVTVEPDSNGHFETSFDFTVDEEIITENCELVMFIQSTREHKIYQGYKMPFTDLIESSVSDDNDNIPNEFALIGNYPNPFNSSTVIEFKTENRGNVKLGVYNIAGKKVVDLIDGGLPAGYHSITFNADELPSGIYFYRLRSNDKTAVGRMTLVK